MSILTNVATDGNLQTVNPGEYNLSLGERWEQILAEYLTASGLPSYRACQRFVKSEVLKKRNKKIKEAILDGFWDDAYCNLKVNGDSFSHNLRAMEKPNFKPHERYRVLPGDPKMDWTLLRPYQRDILVKLDKVRRLSVEVKALTPAAFNRAYIQVGCCEKYDLKLFKIAALVLVNQATGEAFVYTGDTSEMHRQKDANGAGGFSYAIETAKLTPIDAWIDVTKDIYGLGQ